MSVVKERRVTGRKGKTARVVLSRKRYERRAESSVSLEDMKKRLRKRALL